MTTAAWVSLGNVIELEILTEVTESLTGTISSIDSLTGTIESEETLTGEITE